MKWPTMNSPNILVSQGHRLLQVGVALFLFTSFEGFAIPYFASSIVGRSVHTLSSLLGLILLPSGLVWPRLRLGVTGSRIAFGFLVIRVSPSPPRSSWPPCGEPGNPGCPCRGAPLGTAVEEAAITAVAYSSAPTGIIAFALILWGLRTPSNRAASTLDDRR